MVHLRYLTINCKTDEEIIHFLCLYSKKCLLLFTILKYLIFYFLISLRPIVKMKNICSLFMDSQDVLPKRKGR